MKKIYNHKKIEKIIQFIWEKKKIYNSHINNKKKKYYCLCMFPYPSGLLHIGHVRNYTIGDIIARYKRLQNKNVLHPIGWDSFGLPAENAAFQNNILPYKWTKNNIKQMKKQLKKLGFSYDWNREIKTCDSDYYKWEQWLFIKLIEKKIAYKKKELSNWCPKDKTILANEQVLDGKCWRCDTNVEYKYIKQWFLKITDYAERLLKDLDKLKYWPLKVKNMQKNWIGKTKGLNIRFKIKEINNFNIKIYTSKIEFLPTIYSISISRYHKLFNFKKTKKIKIIKNINKKIKNISIKDQLDENYGFFTKINAINPINNKLIPIWLTNFTEEEYNSKIILMTPELNKKHYMFSKKHNLYIKYININNININNLNLKKKNQKIRLLKKKIENILFIKKIAIKTTNFKLKDWSISRQRYWGVPIPIIKNKNNSTVPININKLPIILPKKIKSKKLSYIYKEWKKILYKKNKNIEPYTFDTFLESSWYHLRFTSPLEKKKIFNSYEANYWLPIDIYIGGIEHSTMHLIYIRFINKFIKDLKLIKHDEPIKKLICQGTILSKTFYYINKNKKIWINFNDLKSFKKKNDSNYYIENNKIFFDGINKMSKSKNNGINPNKIIKKYGADTLRLYIIFASPIEKNFEWNDSNIKGCYRFIKKIWELVFNFKYKNNNYYNFSKNEKYLIFFLNKTIYEVTKDLNTKLSLNTAISKIMKFVKIFKNIQKKNNIDYFLTKKCINNIIILLYPFIPHISFYLWKKMENKKIIDETLWPKINKLDLENKFKIPLIIQINGKKKKIIYIKNTYNKDKIINIINKKKILNKLLVKITKIIYIKNKIINFVTKTKKNEKNKH